MMNPGISVDGYHSLDDFGWRLTDRQETPPKLRQTKVTVPYANGSLDYTGVYGEAFYEEKAIAYTFAKDFAGVEDMMEGVREFVAWLSRHLQRRHTRQHVRGVPQPRQLLGHLVGARQKRCAGQGDRILRPLPLHGGGR